MIRALTFIFWIFVAKKCKAARLLSEQERTLWAQYSQRLGLPTTPSQYMMNRQAYWNVPEASLNTARFLLETEATPAPRSGVTEVQLWDGRERTLLSL